MKLNGRKDKCADSDYYCRWIIVLHSNSYLMFDIISLMYFPQGFYVCVLLEK